MLVNLEGIITDFINSFNWSYMFVINLATYLIIKTINDARKKKSMNRFIKILITSIVALSVGVLNYYLVKDVDLLKLVYSFVLSLVSFDYVFKPILKKIELDYKIFDNTKKI